MKKSLMSIMLVMLLMLSGVASANIGNAGFENPGTADGTALWGGPTDWDWVDAATWWTVNPDAAGNVVDVAGNAVAFPVPTGNPQPTEGDNMHYSTYNAVAAQTGLFYEADKEYTFSLDFYPTGGQIQMLFIDGAGGIVGVQGDFTGGLVFVIK